MGHYARSDIYYGILIGSHDDTDDEDITHLQPMLDAFGGDESWGKKYLVAKGSPATSNYADEPACKLSGCFIGSHGNAHYNKCYYFVAVLESHILSSWGEPSILDPKKFEVPVQWDNKLRDFCQTLNIPWKPPRWFLATSLDA